jgi:predicted nucleotide-binding protein (sugar kinase/HSP70/actin superfamily)
MKKKTSWREKLSDSKGLPRVERFDKKKGKNWPAGTYCLPAPIEVDEIMQKVPKGKLITINEIRQILAKKHKADFGCPITTGIFSWLAANAADEMEKEAKKRITPYWRTLKTGGILNEKYLGGLENLKKRLEAEGHTVIQKGRSKHFMVKDFEKSLVNITSMKV